MQAHHILGLSLEHPSAIRLQFCSFGYSPSSPLHSTLNWHELFSNIVYGIMNSEMSSKPELDNKRWNWTTVILIRNLFKSACQYCLVVVSAYYIKLRMRTRNIMIYENYVRLSGHLHIMKPSPGCLCTSFQQKLERASHIYQTDWRSHVTEQELEQLCNTFVSFPKRLK